MQKEKVDSQERDIAGTGESQQEERQQVGSN